MTVEDIIANAEELADTIQVTEDDDIDIVFTSTGSPNKDKAIKALFVDCPRLLKAITKANKWQDFCAAPNPVGYAELFAITNSGVNVDPNTQNSILKLVKTKMISGHLSVLQAFDKDVLKEQIVRVLNSNPVIKSQDLEPTSSSTPDSAIEPKLDVTPVVATVPIVATESSEHTNTTQVVTQNVSEDSLKGKTITHSDGTTYIFGKRGRRPLWVIQWLEEQNKISKVS